MVKFLTLITLFLLTAGGIYAVGIHTTSPLPGTNKEKAKVITVKQAGKDNKDNFKAKYWIIASLFRF